MGCHRPGTMLGGEVARGGAQAGRGDGGSWLSPPKNHGVPAWHEMVLVKMGLEGSWFGGAAPQNGRRAGWLHAGTPMGCSLTGSYWEELEHRGCSFWAVLSCPKAHPTITQLCPAQPAASPLLSLISCISDCWCWPLIRRNSSGKGCNEAPVWLSWDRDDRGNFHAGGGGWIRVCGVIYFFLPSLVLSAFILTTNC